MYKAFIEPDLLQAHLKAGAGLRPPSPPAPGPPQPSGRGPDQQGTLPNAVRGTHAHSCSAAGAAPWAAVRWLAKAYNTPPAHPPMRHDSTTSACTKHHFLLLGRPRLPGPTQIVNSFNPFSGFMNATYILKSRRVPTLEAVTAALEVGGVTPSSWEVVAVACGTTMRESTGANGLCMYSTTFFAQGPYRVAHCRRCPNRISVSRPKLGHMLNYIGTLRVTQRPTLRPSPSLPRPQALQAGATGSASAPAPGPPQHRKDVDIYDIYLLPPDEEPDLCASWLRMRNREGRYRWGGLPGGCGCARSGAPAKLGHVAPRLPGTPEPQTPCALPILPCAELCGPLPQAPTPHHLIASPASVRCLPLQPDVRGDSGGGPLHHLAAHQL